MMAETLQNSCNKALELVKNIDVSKDKTLMYEVADIRIWANLGLYFSEKTRGAVALQMYRKQGGEANKTLAIKHLEKALKYWDEVVEISQPIYNEMPLVHFSEQKNMTKEQFNKQRFHWLIIRTDVAYDIEIAKNAEVDIAIKKLLYSDDFTAAYDTTKWFAELGTNHNSTVSVKNGAMEIDVDYGATVWFKNELKDAWMVEFDRTVPMKGGKNDRLSDFNVFWQATDPHTGKLLGRDPDFKNYDTLSLYYVGMGGNRNTTTRFRKYMGTSSKDVIQEYTDAEHLIEADKIYHCRIVFKKDTTSFYINDALFFTYKDAQPLTHGYFGFRTLRSRQVIDNFKVFEIE